MKFRLFALAAASLVMAQAAAGETCRDRPLSQSDLNTIRDVRSAILAGDETPPIKRDQLEKFRDSKKSCAGQNSFAYLLALLDLQYGSLQESVDAMSVLLATDAPDFEKNRMMKRLIERFVRAGHIQTAIDLAERAETAIPDSAKSYRRERALLLTGKGRFDEARVLVDADFEASLVESPQERIPYSVWVRLAISEVSGDAEDERRVLERVTEALGPAGDELIARDRISMNFQMLMGRSYDPTYWPQPVLPPTPGYPKPMLYARKSGSCDVKFDVTDEGVPINVTAECDEQGFVEESIRAMADVRFSALVVDGIPRRSFSIVYPLEYRIQY